MVTIKEEGNWGDRGKRGWGERWGGRVVGWVEETVESEDGGVAGTESIRCSIGIGLGWKGSYSSQGHREGFTRYVFRSRQSFGHGHRRWIRIYNESMREGLALLRIDRFCWLRSVLRGSITLQRSLAQLVQ